MPCTVRVCITFTSALLVPLAVLQTSACHAWMLNTIAMHTCSLASEQGLSRQVPLMVACVSSFLEAPRLQISYTLASGQQCNQNLRLPLTVNKFCRAPENAIPADMFFTRWRSLAGAPLIPSFPQPFRCIAWISCLPRLLLAFRQSA